MRRANGMQGLMDGRFPGKMVIYPQVEAFPLTVLADLKTAAPTVYVRLWAPATSGRARRRRSSCGYTRRGCMHERGGRLRAGNIGRGFIGPLFSESGCAVTLVDVDQPLLDALNRRGEYTIRLVTNEQSDEVTVGPVRGVHAGDLDAVAEAVARASVGATAVGAGAAKHVAPAIGGDPAPPRATGVSEPLNIIVCENLKGAAAILRELVQTALTAGYHDFMAEQIGFVDTVIARMVPPLTPELHALDPSLIIVEPYKELPVDRAGFVGEPPAIIGMIPYVPFVFFTERKLYIHNVGHAVLAYLGYLGGYEYGYEALADDEIYFQARGAMEESALALTRKHRPPAGALLANVDDLLHRFGNRALGDTILRLAAIRSASWPAPTA